MSQADFETVFAALKALLEPYAAFSRVNNTPKMFYLETEKLGPNKKPYEFGAVRMGKNYVSYYLMPVYMYPELLDSISDKLKKRMQGKSCFNFKTVDPDLFDELEALTRRGFERFKADGLIEDKS